MTMTDELTADVRTLAFLLVAIALGVLLFVPTASAQEAACTTVLENRTELANDSAAPGGLLAEAIGDQRDQIGSELDDDGFQARLENATSARERARVVADEVDRIESNLSTLERCWGVNGTEPEANRTLAELDEDEREALENYSRSLHARLNDTRTEADRLPVSLRDRHDLGTERLDSMEQRIRAARNETAPEETTFEDPFPF